jgi:hypothetical protein
MNQNIKKWVTSDIIEQLKKRILDYTSDWKEHDWCVEYIKAMK